MRGCRVHRLIARRARRLGSRRASHLVDVVRKRSCAGSVHSSGSFCTKQKAWTPRTPLSWFAAGAPDQMPAARRPAMHHSSLCAGAYPQGLRDANGLAKEVVGIRRARAFFCGENRIGFSGPYPPLAGGGRDTRQIAARAGTAVRGSRKRGTAAPQVPGPGDVRTRLTLHWNNGTPGGNAWRHSRENDLRYYDSSLLAASYPNYIDPISLHISSLSRYRRRGLCGPTPGLFERRGLCGPAELAAEGGC